MILGIKCTHFTYVDANARTKEILNVQKINICNSVLTSFIGRSGSNSSAFLSALKCTCIGKRGSTFSKYILSLPCTFALVQIQYNCYNNKHTNF